jgi:hypothetical protein
LDSHRATELEPGIVQLELTRPHRNALSSKAVAELHHEIDLIGGDPAIRVVILTGEGPSFCAGAVGIGCPRRSIIGISERQTRLEYELAAAGPPVEHDYSRIPVDGRRAVKVDIAISTLRVIVECDGSYYHAKKAQESLSGLRKGSCRGAIAPRRWSPQNTVIVISKQAAGERIRWPQPRWPAIFETVYPPRPASPQGQTLGEITLPAREGWWRLSLGDRPSGALHAALRSWLVGGRDL